MVGRRVGRVVAALLALTVLVGTAGAQASSQLRDGLERTEEQRERTARDLDARRAEEGDARGRLAAAEEAHATARGALDRIEARLEQVTADRESALERAQDLRDRLAAVERELTVAEDGLAEVQTRFDSRVAGAYKRGSTRAETALVGQLLTQDTIADALATQPFLTAVMDADRRVVSDLHEVRDEVTRQRAEAASLRNAAEREAQRADRAARDVASELTAQERVTAELAEARAELDAAHDAIVADRRAVESHLASLESESQRIEGELAAIAEQRRREAADRAAQEAQRRAQQDEPDSEDASDGGAQDGSPGNGAGDGPGAAPPGQATPPPSGGSWGWPAACGRVTSRYGGRSVAGGSAFHRGVDIACTRVLGPNPAITASRSGVVSPVGCGGGYGVCLIVDHLDGFFTLYAHMSSTAVTPGTSVGAGQVIGYEGSTGNSTGPHLHFEIWDGATKVDPCPRIGC